VRVLKLDEINGVSDCFEGKKRKKMEVKELIDSMEETETCGCWILCLDLINRTTMCSKLYLDGRHLYSVCNILFETLL